MLERTRSQPACTVCQSSATVGKVDRIKRIKAIDALGILTFKLALPVSSSRLGASQFTLCGNKKIEWLMTTSLPQLAAALLFNASSPKSQQLCTKAYCIHLKKWSRLDLTKNPESSLTKTRQCSRFRDKNTQLSLDQRVNYAASLICP